MSVLRSTINDRRMVLRGDTLPSLLIGSTLIDLRATARTCMEEYNLSIELYQQINSHGNGRTRTFLGRDFSQPTETASAGVDYRIEICQCIPNIINVPHRNDRELGMYVREFTSRREMNVASRGTGAGVDVRTVPSFRIYEFETRPPFGESFVREVHQSSNVIPPLAHILAYYLRFSDRSMGDSTLPLNLRHQLQDSGITGY